MATQPNYNPNDLMVMRTDFSTLENYFNKHGILKEKIFIRLANAVEGWNIKYPHIIITDIEAIELVTQEGALYKLRLITKKGSFLLYNNTLHFFANEKMPEYTTERKFTFPNL